MSNKNFKPVSPDDPAMAAVIEAYDSYIEKRDEGQIAVLRARADLAEKIQEAKKAGISIHTQSVVLGLDRTWVFRLAQGGGRPVKSHVVAVSRLAEGTLVGDTRSDWQAKAEGISNEREPVPPPPVAIEETVIVPKIPDCRYCNKKATRVIEYGNGKQAMVCEDHAPQLPSREISNEVE